MTTTSHGTGNPETRKAPGLRGAGLALLAALAAACGSPEAPGEEGDVEVVVPSGASFAEVADSLEAQGLIRMPLIFRISARLSGDDRQVHAGTYRFSPDADRGEILEALRTGRVVQVSVTIPEGFTLARIGPRLAEVLDLEADSVGEYLRDPARAEEFGVPGPTLEGYLYPETYRFAEGVPLERAVGAMLNRYRSIWTDERRARAEALGLSEREAVTLASIVEAEATVEEEKPRIAGVFLNRLEIGYPLQADPTVIYALGEHRERLLYAAIDSVEGHPYNTYTEPGLPPGPIGSPGSAAIDAVLDAEDHDYLYFVARLDGTHQFSRTLEEHNRARAELQRMRREADGGGSP